MLCSPQLTLRKKHFFVIEKYVEDVKQHKEYVPDLLESIMTPLGHVKEELRPILFKMDRLDRKCNNSLFQLFESWEPDVFPPEANASRLASRF